MEFNWIKKNKLITVLIIIISLCSLSFYIRSYSLAKESESLIDRELLETHYYSFGIDTTPFHNVQLQDFQIYYDFVSQEGSLSFVLKSIQSLEILTIALPVQLEIVNLSWYDSRLNQGPYDLKSQNGSYFISGSQDITSRAASTTSYFIMRYNKTIEGHPETQVKVFFKGKLYPNAQFEFNPNSERIIPPKGKENGAFFKFYHGNRYSCINDCFSPFREGELTSHPEGSILKISTLKEAQSWKDVEYTLFNLNYNGESNPKRDELIKKSDNWRGWAFDILLSLLFFILGIIYSEFSSKIK